jgi:hypothetical protein
LIRGLRYTSGCLIAGNLDSAAESFDCQTQNLDAFVELIDGNELTGAMRDANVAWAKDDGVRTQSDHAGGFGAKGERARSLGGLLFEKVNQRRVRSRFEGLIRARGDDLTNEI